MKIGVGLQGINRERTRLRQADFDVLLFMQYDILEIRAMRQLGWKGQAWFRYYHSNCMKYTPSEFAAMIVQWLVENDDVGITDVIPWNELNLADEHDGEPFATYRLNEWGEPETLWWDCPEAYIVIAAWCSEFIDAFNHLCDIFLSPQNYDLHWGALSPGHDGLAGPESEYDFFVESLSKVKWVDIHVYGAIDDSWTGSGRAVRIVHKLNSMRIETKYISITEVNQVDFHQLCLWLRNILPELYAVIWFLWCAVDSKHSAWDLVKWDLTLLMDFIKLNRMEVLMPEYRFGVAESVKKLRADGIEPGEPLTDEYYFTPYLAIQWTENGIFWIRRLEGTDVYLIQYHAATA